MAYTTIDNPELYFQVKTYTGNGTAIGSGGLAVTLDGDENMQPDLVWIKVRSTTHYHVITDAVRGATKQIYPNDPQAEGTRAEGLTAFGSDGFTLGNEADTNQNTATYVAFCWKETATAGFDIVTWTGNATNRTISHSLSAVPKMIIIKERDGTSGWITYHTGLTAEDDYLVLNTTAAEDDTYPNLQATAPTSSVFSVGTAQGTNGNTATYVAYAFAEKQGFSKFGKYEGNNNANGTFVYTGFRPAFVMNKQTDGTEGWMIHDNKRNPSNPLGFHFTANGVGSDSNRVSVDFLSNGFKWRVANTDTNNGDYIYMAFAEAPFVNSKGVPCNAR